MKFEIEEFSPKKAELLELVNKYQALKINGLEDEQGYLAVKEARKELQSTRTDITNKAKALRQGALQFQRDVIAREKELIGIISTLELELKNQTDAIDLEKEKIKRQALLPERKALLSSIEVEISDELILEMNDKEFAEMFINLKAEFLAKKEADILHQQQEQIEKENELKRQQEELEKQKQHQKEIEQAKKEAEKNAKILADKRLKDLKEKAEKDKQKAIADERQRLADEQKAKEEADKKEQANKKVQKWLKDNGYKEGDKIHREGNLFILYREVSRFNLE